MILSTSPRLILPAIAQANVDLLALALDVMVPPLSLLVMLVMGTWVVAVCDIARQFFPAMFVSSASLVGLAGAVFISWLKYGRDILPSGSISSIFFYVFGNFHSTAIFYYAIVTRTGLGLIGGNYERLFGRRKKHRLWPRLP